MMTADIARLRAGLLLRERREAGSINTYHKGLPNLAKNEL
jgi:hypothetical protein